MPQVRSGDKVATPATAKAGASEPVKRGNDQHGPLPTDLEIEEGAALKRSERKPTSDELYTQWVFLSFRIQREQGVKEWGVSRCPECRVLRYGRPLEAPCGYCGAPMQIGRGHAFDGTERDPLKKEKEAKNGTGFDG